MAEASPGAELPGAELPRAPEAHQAPREQGPPPTAEASGGAEARPKASGPSALLRGSDRTTVRRLWPVPITPASWAPFGWIPVPDTDPTDGAQRLAFEWGDVHVNVISHQREEVPQGPGSLCCQVLYRHRTHTQVLMPLDADAVVVVAAPGSEPGRVSSGGEMVAFHLPRLAPIVLHRGTWHWGPYPVLSRSVQLFNVQGWRYLEDNDRFDLVDRHAEVEVIVG